MSVHDGWEDYENSLPETVEWVCSEHILDKKLWAKLEHAADSDEVCDLCEGTRPIPFETIVEEVEGAIDRHFYRAEESGRPWDEVEEGLAGEYFGTQQVIEDELGLDDRLDADLFPALLGKISDTSWIRGRDNEMTSAEQASVGWADLRRILTDESRFFALTPKTMGCTFHQ
jgi:HEPN/RES N-terminal domain 1